MKNSREINRTLLELIIGDIAYGVIGTVPVVLLSKDGGKSVLLFWMGIIIAIVMAVLIYTDIRKFTHMDADAVHRRMRVTVGLRYTFVAVILFVMSYLTGKYIIATLIGIMSLKVSAYAQPLTHKLLDRFYGREGG